MRTRSTKSTQISSLVLWASEQCHKVSESPQLDAEILLAFCLQKPRSYLRTWPEKQLSEEQIIQLEQLIKTRLLPTPIAYLTGYKEFWSLDFKVNASTLIPRPETELLIEKALELIPHSTPYSILDLGTGSGCIAITLKKECPQCQITAADMSRPALEIAQQNARLHQTDIDWIQSSWFENITLKSFQLIVSNPPYIKANDPHLTRGDLPAEPLSALVSGTTGLDDIKLICHQAQHYLTAGGTLMLEHGYDQKNAVRQIFEDENYSNIQQFDDLLQQARITSGVKK